MKRKILAIMTVLGLLFAAAAVPVTAEETEPAVLAAAAEGAVALPEEALACSGAGTECRQIPCEARGGVYLLYDSSLSFYSLEDGQVTAVCDLRQEPYNTDMGGSYVADGKLYAVEYPYAWGTDTGPQSHITVFDLARQETTLRLTVPYQVYAVGADAEGRMYLAGRDSDADTWPLWIYSPAGEPLGEGETYERVYRFAGFDSANGNFYYECYYNWVYWGYDHDMRALGAGRVEEDNTVTIDDQLLALVSQMYFYERQRGVEMLGGRYLCADSTYSSTLTVWDSHDYVIGGEENAACLVQERDNFESGSFDAAAAVGARAVLLERTGTLVAFQDSQTLAEYDLTTGDRIRETGTAHPVFSLLPYDGGVLAFEKEEDAFYLEYFPWIAATQVTLAGPRALTVGETVSLTAQTDGTVTEALRWSSSANAVATVNAAGEVFGWRAGTAEITASTRDGIAGRITVTVEADGSIPASAAVTLDGTACANLSRNHYTVWSAPMTSYLMQNADGTLTRVESGSSGVLVETYTLDGRTRLDARTLPQELSLFGGFYAGTDANYLVFGQANPEESDTCEVMRVVKYDRDWNRAEAASVYGANTYIPFDAGSLRMTELDGLLYIYTCHEMYQSSDGYHHQANMTFVLDESTMQMAQSYFEVMNLAQAGYVSHSFNQFIRTDGAYVYRVDHGDAYPRAVSITRCEAGGDITEVRYTLPFAIEGAAGVNATGVSVGGFALSRDNCLIAGNSVAQAENVDYGGQRNIFLTVTDKALTHTETLWLTDYAADAGVTVRTPQLVQLSADAFLLLWEETADMGKTVTTKAVTVDGGGVASSEVTALAVRLSDCQPILCADGAVRWYAGDGTPVLYTLNPYSLAAVHTHAFSYAHDESRHWLVCGCGERQDTAAHTWAWVTDVPATENEAGVKHEVCAVCGYVRAEGVSIPPLSHVHELTYLPAQAATLASSGHIACWYCAGCGKYFADGDASYELLEADVFLPSLRLGDVNGDGSVDTTDARLTLQYAAKRVKEDKLNLTAADVNGDGGVDTTDARLILQYAAKRIKDFPAAK